MGNDEYKIYVAKNPSTGLFLVRALRFLMGNQDWLKAANPTDQEV